MFYRYQSTDYRILPDRIRLPDGSTRTSLNDLSEAELTALGIEILEGTYPPPPTIDEVKAQRLNELAAYRFTKETAGITLNGMTIETDRQSQALITGAWSISQINPAVLINWKGVNGWIQIDAAMIGGIAMAVATHVQACFSRERVHAEAIAALETSAAVNEYDMTTDWPA